MNKLDRTTKLRLIGNTFCATAWWMAVIWSPRHYAFLPAAIVWTLISAREWYIL